MRKNIVSTVLIAVVIVGVAAFFYKRYHIPPKVDIPTLAVSDLNGNKMSLQSYRGRPLFISFFATWCGPCIRELPEIIDLKQKLTGMDLQIICISDEPIEKLLNLQNRIGNQLIILHAENNLRDIGIYTFPTNYIYDASGKMIYEKTNSDNWTDKSLENRIKSGLE